MGLDFELLNIVQSRLHRVSVADRAVIVDAVQQVHIAAVILAIDRGKHDGSGLGGVEELQIHLPRTDHGTVLHWLRLAL